MRKVRFNSIDYYINNNPIINGWELAIDAAAYRWNLICGINFQRTYSSWTADIEIYSVPDISSDCGVGVYPSSSGSPGEYIFLNDRANQLGYSAKVNLMMHEFGHTIGFLHTDEEHPNIPGTSSGDYWSVMHSKSCGRINSFTTRDVLAARYLYGY